MAYIKLASFDGGGGIGIYVDYVLRQYHDLLMYGWEFLGDPTVEVPPYLLCRIEYLPSDEESGTEHDLTDDERRKWLAAFAKAYAHDEELRQMCADAEDCDYPIENPQVEDDEEKEVVEATTESSEDTHGGSEATKSIEDSPSSADDGEEEKNNSTSKGKGEGESDGSSGENGDTDAAKEGKGAGTESKEGEGSSVSEDTDAGKEGSGTGTEPGDGDGSGVPEDTDADKEGKDSGSGDNSSKVTNKIVTDLISAFEREAKTSHDKETVTRALAVVIKNTKGKSDKGGRLGGWDGRAITKHYISGMLNRIPTDRKRYGAVKQVTVAIDCSGSCWTYLNEINRAIRHMARFYNVQILDCSNGFNPEKDSTILDKDPYDNRKRLEEAFCNGRIKMHPTITTPSIKTAAKIAEKSEAFIVLADYDGYKSICRMVQQVTNPEKYPWFLDLEERYEDPSSHNWNYDSDEERFISADDYPEPARKRWLRLFDRGYDDDDDE